MGLSLAKGNKISLAKVAEEAGVSGGLSRLVCGLGWDCNSFDSGADFDLDATVFLCDVNGEALPGNDGFVFYNNKKIRGVEHMGDNKTGVGDGDDEVIKVELGMLPEGTQKLAFAVTIHDADVRKQNFGMVSNSYIRLVDENTNTELLRYDLGEDYSVETALVVAEIYNHNGEWKFNAIGAGFAGGLAALCNKYHVLIN